MDRWETQPRWEGKRRRRQRESVHLESPGRMEKVQQGQENDQGDDELSQAPQHEDYRAEVQASSKITAQRHWTPGLQW